MFPLPTTVERELNTLLQYPPKHQQSSQKVCQTFCLYINSLTWPCCSDLECIYHYFLKQQLEGEVARADEAYAMAGETEWWSWWATWFDPNSSLYFNNFTKAKTIAGGGIELCSWSATWVNLSSLNYTKATMNETLCFFLLPDIKVFFLFLSVETLP